MINNTLSLSSQTTTPAFIPKKSSTLSTPVTGMMTTAKPAGSVTGSNLNNAIANLNKAVAPVARPSNNPTQTTSSGGTVENINGGQAYSNPLDNPAYLAKLQQTPTQQTNNSQTQDTTGTQPVKGLFPDVSTSLYGGIVGQGQNQLSQAATVGQEAANVRRKIALDTQGVMGDANYSGPVRIGQAGIIQQNLGPQLDALTAQQQALTSTGNSFLNAASAVKPEVSSFGQTSFNPVTGQFAGGNGNLDPQSAANDLAQKVASGQMTYEQAVSSLGYAGSAGQQFLNQAIQKINPNFNAPQSSASIGANAGVVQQATGDISNMQTNLSAADTNLSQLTNLAAQNGINDLSSVTANRVANLFKGEFSNQALLSFNALIAGTRALYAAVLESRANLAPTDAYNAAVQQVPDNVNLASLKNLTGTLKTEAQNIISAKQQQIQNAKGGTTNPTSNTSSSSGGLFNF